MTNIGFKRYNHYQVTLYTPDGFVLMNEQVPFTARKSLMNLMRGWAKIYNGQYLQLQRGQRSQWYERRTISSNHDYRWVQLGGIVAANCGQPW